MSNILVSMPEPIVALFEACMNRSSHRYKRHGQGLLQGNSVQMYTVQNMTIEEVHLLLKTYIQTRVNAHEIQASL
jgi:hypothetical protein